VIEEEQNFLGLAERMQSKILQEKLKSEHRITECQSRSEVMKVRVLDFSYALMQLIKPWINLNARYFMVGYPFRKIWIGDLKGF